MLIWGIVWIRNVQVPYDYSQWLGPNWKVRNAKYTGAGTIVANH